MFLRKALQARPTFCGTALSLASSRLASTDATFSGTTGIRRFQNKVALVTASTDGIGLAIARRLGIEGAHVVISSRRQTNVDRALDELRSEGLSVSGQVCHVANPSHRASIITKTVEDQGGIDVLVSNAGVNTAFIPTIETNEEQWDKMFDVNVKATFFLIKEVVPYMEKRGGGSIVMDSSIAGYIPQHIGGAYAITKTALLSMTKSLVVDLAQKNIRINCIAPGLVKTKFNDGVFKDVKIVDDVMRQIPMKRAATPDEMAGAVAFLASDDASYITAETILITGGVPIRL